MRMIIQARIDDGVGGGEAIRLAEFERLDGDLKQLGLSLAEAEVWCMRRSTLWSTHRRTFLLSLPELARSAVRRCRSKRSTRTGFVAIRQPC